MQLMRHNPINDLLKLEREFDGLSSTLSMPTEYAPMDMYEEDGKFVAKVALPHFYKDEIKVSTDNDILEITAEHSEQKESKNKRRYYLRESSNSYIRRVRLPQGVSPEEIEAEYRNGVLTIVMTSKTLRAVKAVKIK